MEKEAQETEKPSERKSRKPKQTSAPQIIYKGNQTFRHDLFKASLEKYKKNLSFRKGVVKIEHIDHIHYFHTFDSNGKAQKFTNTVGGHFHEIRWFTDDDGVLRAECGPPLTTVYKKRAGMQKRVIEPVKWEDEEHDRMVADEHKHTMEYMWSEELDANTVRKRRNAAQSLFESEQAMRIQAQSLGMEKGFD